MIDRLGTSYVKGIAIIMVIVGHLFLLTGVQGKLVYVAAYGVAIFLITSGYGLVKSHDKSGLESYFSKKFLKIYLPYLIATITFLIVSISVLSLDISTKNIILSLMGIDYEGKVDPTMWYITYIFVWYMVFWIAFKIRVPKWIKLIIVTLPTVFFMYAYNAKLTPLVSWNYKMYSIFFPIGICFGLYLDNVAKKLYKGVVVILVTIIGSIGIFYAMDYVPQFMKYYMFASLLFAMISIVIIGYIRKKNIEFKLLKVVGDNSYYIYLVEGFFLFKIKTLEITSNKYISISFYLLVVIVATIILKYVSEKVLSYETNKA